MKIAFIHQPINFLSLPDQEGSVEIITYELARHLAKHCDVIVYSKKGPNQKEYEYYEGVLYQRISTNIDEKLEYITSGIDRRLWRLQSIRHPLFASNLYYLTYALKIAKDINFKKCDIVHIQNFSQFIPIIRALNPKIKIVLHMHCEWLTQLNHRMIESRLEKTDLIIGVSNYLTDKIRSHFPQFANRCHTVYNGVDVTTFVKKNDGVLKNDIKQLLFVGRVSPEKGVHVLLDAFLKVLNEYPHAKLKLIGPQNPLPIERLIALSNDPRTKGLIQFYKGEYISHLKNKLDLNTASKVSFLGSFPHKKIISFYRDADVCVVPSVCNEPSSLPVLEAMATGVPIIATRSGGIPELVEDGKAGFLVERDDASSLAEAILRLFLDDKLKKSMGTAAYERAVKFFSWPRIVEKLLIHYNGLFN